MKHLPTLCKFPSVRKQQLTQLIAHYLKILTRRRLAEWMKKYLTGLNEIISYKPQLMEKYLTDGSIVHSSPGAYSLLLNIAAFTEASQGKIKPKHIYKNDERSTV